MSKMLLARSVVIFVSAMAMTRQEYNDLRGWQLPENENGSDAGYLIEDSEGEQNTDKFKGFVQWLPKSEFERKYIVESDEKHPKEDAPKDIPIAQDPLKQSPIMQYFSYTHLPDKLQSVSKPIFELARQLDNSLNDGPEKSTGLRKLLEAKDCFVRQALN